MARAAVIVPVRNGAHLLRQCLEPLIEQADPLRAQVIVVDDASRDGSADLAEHVGARALRLPAPSGPYAARNKGWRLADAEVVVFTDVRCRARTGWLEAMVGALGDPSVAITGGDVIVEPGRGVGARLVRAAQPLAPGAAHEFLPWFPTACLGTRRSVLEALGGFRERRGGADVDFCWRAQLSDLGRLEIAKGATMDWEARPSMRETLSQIHRYGSNYRTLQQEFARYGCPATAPTRFADDVRTELRNVRTAVREGGLRSVRGTLSGALYRTVFASGFRSAARSE